MTQPETPNRLSDARPLAELLRGLSASPVRPGGVPQDLLISDITLDSRAVTPGSLFLACKGRTHHGLKFAEQAVARGARAVLFETDAAVSVPHFGSEIFVAEVPELSRQAGVLADRFFGSPSQALTVVGITGTNGKTTSAWLLAQALQLCGRPAAYMGTIGYGRPPAVTATEHTTSDAVTVHRHLAACRALGAECVAMEVSSHALDQDRVAGVRFNTAAFTNLTRDHLDYHGTMEAYGSAKARLFTWPGLANRVINVDDAFGAQLAHDGLAGQLSPARLVITTRRGGDVTNVGALRQAQFVRATQVTLGPAGLTTRIESSWGSGELVASLVGDFNVENLLTVLGVLLAWNIPFAEAVRALAQCKAASGRMEMFGGGGQAPLVIVDYAHTPDGLAKALSAARRHCRGKLRVVFGCGGDRDPGKRPEMGRIAAELADDLIVTDDNPRTEDPALIVAGILGGIPQNTPSRVVHDRALAIHESLECSGPDDVIVIAGKGHEDYQIYGTTRRHFSDQEIVRAELGRRLV
jgi:UDP-N-acetylmuramoyl-L-alanyl-D-glutamate--2,6-diaminopimelate ligase